MLCVSLTPSPPAPRDRAEGDSLTDRAKEAAKAIHGCTASKRERLAALSDLRDEIDIIIDALKNDTSPMDDDD